jgi:hypothetical protein
MDARFCGHDRLKVVANTAVFVILHEVAEAHFFAPATYAQGDSVNKIVMTGSVIPAKAGIYVCR